MPEQLTETQIKARIRELTAAEVMAVQMQVKRKTVDNKYFRLMRAYRIIHNQIVQLNIDLKARPCA